MGFSGLCERKLDLDFENVINFYYNPKLNPINVPVRTDIQKVLSSHHEIYG